VRDKPRNCMSSVIRQRSAVVMGNLLFVVTNTQEKACHGHRKDRLRMRRNSCAERFVQSYFCCGLPYRSIQVCRAGRPRRLIVTPYHPVDVVGCRSSVGRNAVRARPSRCSERQRCQPRAERIQPRLPLRKLDKRPDHRRWCLTLPNQGVLKLGRRLGKRAVGDLRQP